MSLINMESWMAFQRHTGDDADTAANNTVRAEARTSIALAGYETLSLSANAGWIIRQHPIYPERNALTFSAPGPTNTQYYVRRRVAAPGQTVIGGFSLFVPAGYIPSVGTGSSVFALFTVLAQAQGSAINTVTDATTAHQYELFRIRHDLQIAYGTEVQSQKSVQVGKMSYLEYQITPTEFRVWLDDVLVLQKTLVANPYYITFCISVYSPQGGSIAANAVGRFALADHYNLLVDAETPNVRLGFTTRVIGTKPASDDFTQFARPGGFTSNAAVTALPMRAAETNFLKTDTVGVMDVYNGAPDSDTATAGIIHAVGVKALAQNLEGTPHTLAPLIVSNGTAAGAAQPLTAAMSTLTTISNVDPNTGLPWTPAAAAATKFGIKLQS